MLRSMNDLEDYSMQASDGNIGHLKDLSFDDKAWVVRYLIVDTGTWLHSHAVLISPIGIGAPNWGEKIIPVSLTKEQIKNAPQYDAQKPITKQNEMEYLDHYHYPYYWSGSSLWSSDIYPAGFNIGSGGFNVSPSVLRPLKRESVDIQSELPVPHELHSGSALIGSLVQGRDGDVGQVSDFIVDEQSWAIRYLVVDTGDWWHAHKVLIAPQWIVNVNWLDTEIAINMSRQDVKDAPHFEPEATIGRDLEVGLHEHYGRPGYWIVEVERAEQLHAD